MDRSPPPARPASVQGHGHGIRGDARPHPKKLAKSYCHIYSRFGVAIEIAEAECLPDPPYEQSLTRRLR